MFVVQSLVGRLVDPSPLVRDVVVMTMMLKLRYAYVRLRFGKVRQKVDPQGQVVELDPHQDIVLIQLRRQKKLPCQVREGSLVLQLCRLVEVEFLSSSREVLCWPAQLSGVS